MSVPDVRCEVAFANAPDDPAPAWTDVTPYLLLSDGVSVTLGRGDKFTSVQPSQASWTLDNSDGRFTVGLTSSPYYPNVKIGRKCRLRVRDSGSGNFVTNSSFEVDTAGWVSFGAATVARSNTRAQDGSWSLRIDWAATASLSGTSTVVTGLTIGRTYTASAYVWVPTGGEVVSLSVNGFGLGTASSVTNAWQRLQTSFTATANMHTVSVSQFSVGTGYSSYLDAVQVDEGTAAGTFTASAPPVTSLFTGYVDEWPVEWAPTARWAQARVSATDRFKRLGQIGEFSNVIAEEILQDNPTAYFMLGEDAESTVAGDTSRNGQQRLQIGQAGTGGTLEFAAGTGPGTDGLSAPVFTPVSSANGKYLAGTLRAGAGFLNATIRATMNTTSAVQTSIIRVVDPYGSYIDLGTDATGKLRASIFNVFLGVNLAAAASAATVNNGSTYDVAATVTVAGGTVTLRVYLDGVNVGTDSYADSTIPFCTRVFVGGTADGPVFSGTIAHAAVFESALTATRIAAHAAAALNGFAGESSDARIARYARWAGITDTNLDAGASVSIAAVDTTGLAPLSAMQDIADTEAGLLFVDADGVLRFQARTHRYNANPVLTVDGNNDQVPVDVQFVSNDQLLFNDVTATRVGGATIRVVDQDSIDDYGLYRKQITLLTTSDDEVRDAATWVARQTADPAPRIPALSLDLLTDTTLRTQVLGLKLGDLITVTNLPPQAPATTVSLFVEGMTTTVSTSQWVTSLSTSPAVQSSVWVLEDPDYGAIDSTNRIAY